MRTDRKIDVPFKTQQFVILAAQMGSFRKAARALGVDSSVVIRSVDRLESDLGVKIFERNRNRFAVTEAGGLLVCELLKAVAHVERACDLSRYRAQIERGPFRLGYSAYVHSRLIPILERLDLSSGAAAQNVEGEKSPTPLRTTIADSKVVLESGSTTQLVDRVLRGGLHAALGVSPLLEDDLSVQSITREPFCLCVSKNHRFARQPSVLARELNGEMLFFLPQAAHPKLYDRTIEYIESTGAVPVLREVMSFTHTMEIVAHNFGVALLPRSASRLSHTGVLFKPITDRLLWIETALFHRRDQRDDNVRWFLRELLSQIRAASLDQ